MLTNAYCTLAQLKAEVLPATSSTFDSQLEASINAASRQIDGWCGWRFWQDASVVAREFRADDPRYCCIPEGISTTTGLIVKIDDDGDGTFETTLTVNTDFYLAPLNADGDGRGWSELVLANNYGFPVLANGRPGVQVTARFGWPTVPDVVVEATINQAILLYKSKDSAFGAAALPDGTAVFTPALNKTTKALLAGVRVEPVG